MESPAGTRVIRSGAESTLQVRRATLAVVRGPDRGAKVELGERGSALIGKDPECDLVLSDDSVSWRHAEIRACPTGFVLRDLGSTNGTKLGGCRVVEVVLGADVQLSVGETTLKLQVSGDEVSHALSKGDRFGTVLGGAAVMRQMFALLERAAGTDSTVLLEGESGTGKEGIAQSIHAASSRARGPMVIVDCSAIPPTLIEAELFGHEKGAFTGANVARAGAIEEASSGTLFLDEIGELPLDMQPKFLRALEQRQVKRVGSSTYREVDVRIVAATNRDLLKRVQDEKFRSDLYYRLAVMKIAVPALRHHLDDVPLLAAHFIKQVRPGVDPGELLTSSVMAAFSGYAWPGNVRELRNAIERLLAYGDLEEAIVDTGDRTDPRAPASVGDYQHARRAAIEHFEHEYCVALLADCGGVVAAAAERAGISRAMLYKLLKKYGIAL